MPDLVPRVMLGPGFAHMLAEGAGKIFLWRGKKEDIFIL